MAPPAPAYLKALETGILQRRADQGLEALTECTLCPRSCGVNRTAGETGTCKTGRRAVVASYNAHFGEETPLVGRNGSGTIFFSHCSLQCNFCQNYEISHLGEGRALADDQLATIMLELQQTGCHNINLVTPSHVVPQILAAVHLAAQRGLDVPLVYNCSGYDRVETLQLLDGIVDIYMPDFKFWDSKVARDTCNAPDYPEVGTARAARNAPPGRRLGHRQRQRTGLQRHSGAPSGAARRIGRNGEDYGVFGRFTVPEHLCQCHVSISPLRPGPRDAGTCRRPLAGRIRPGRAGNESRRHQSPGQTPTGISIVVILKPFK